MNDRASTSLERRPEIALWRRRAAVLIEGLAILTALLVATSLLAATPRPSAAVVVAVVVMRLAVPWLDRGSPRERLGRGDRTLGVVRRPLLGAGRWEVEAADGRRYEVSTPMGFELLLPLEVGAPVALRCWPDGSARLERPAPGPA